MIIKDLSIVEYQKTLLAMQEFTDNRNENTPDEIWLLQHFPVITLGQQGERGHILHRNEIPIVQTDRGGHVTYHGPGQLIVYPLLNLRRSSFGIRQVVRFLESIIIKLLMQFDIESYARPDAPGVYVQGDKIASLGLRVRKGCTYHGLAINVAMDLSPFSHINPCGMAEMRMTQLKNFILDITMEDVIKQFIACWYESPLYRNQDIISTKNHDIISTKSDNLGNPHEFCTRY